MVVDGLKVYLGDLENTYAAPVEFRVCLSTAILPRCVLLKFFLTTLAKLVAVGEYSRTQGKMSVTSMSFGCRKVLRLSLRNDLA